MTPKIWDIDLLNSVRNIDEQLKVGSDTDRLQTFKGWTHRASMAASDWIHWNALWHLKIASPHFEVSQCIPMDLIWRCRWRCQCRWCWRCRWHSVWVYPYRHIFVVNTCNQEVVNWCFLSGNLTCSLFC